MQTAGAQAGNPGQGSLLRPEAVPEGPASLALALHVWLSVMTMLLTPLSLQRHEALKLGTWQGDPLDAAPATRSCPEVPGLSPFIYLGLTCP